MTLENVNFDHAIGFNPANYDFASDVPATQQPVRPKFQFVGVATRVESNVIPLRDMTLRPTED